jgi:hypothetical protein
MPLVVFTKVQADGADHTVQPVHEGSGHQTAWHEEQVSSLLELCAASL